MENCPERWMSSHMAAHSGLITPVPEDPVPSLSSGALQSHVAHVYLQLKHLNKLIKLSNKLK